MALEKHQTVIDELMDEVIQLREENDHLKAEIRRLGGAGGIIQQRRCINCRRSMPDGPSYFPGYLEPMGKDQAAEAYRQCCVYCRGQGR